MTATGRARSPSRHGLDIGQGGDIGERYGGNAGMGGARHLSFRKAETVLLTALRRPL